jgi:hypothetical protein
MYWFSNVGFLIADVKVVLKVVFSFALKIKENDELGNKSKF